MNKKLGRYSILSLFVLFSCQTRRIQLSGFGGDFKANNSANVETSVDDSHSERLSILNQENIESIPTSANTRQNKRTGIVENIKTPKTFISKRSILNIKKKLTPNDTKDASDFWGVILVLGFLVAIAWGLTILGLTWLQVLLVFLGVIVFVLLLGIIGEVTG